MGVPEVEQREEKEEGRNNKMEGEISEDDILPIQRTTRGGRVIKKLFLPSWRKIEGRGTLNRNIEPQPEVVTEMGVVTLNRNRNRKQEPKPKQ